MKSVFPSSFIAISITCPVLAADIETTVFDITSASLSIFGVQFASDYLGPATGEIVETRAELTYENPGPLDATDLIITFQAPSEGVPVWQFTGADLGWSGTGTFEASLTTDELNGIIDLGDPPPDFGLYLLALQAVDLQPMSGSFVDSRFEVDIALRASTPGDLDGDDDVDFSDLLALLNAWGPCEADCPEDLDRSDDVGFADLLVLLSNWT